MTVKRTHLPGELRAEHIEQEVTLAGWVHRVRDHGGLVFVDLRDRSGLVQLVADARVSPDLSRQASTLKHESVVMIRGRVRQRAPEAVNPDLPTGQVEVALSELEILNASRTPPFLVTEADQVDEALRLRYRYLDLRRPRLQHLLRLRHEVLMAVRNYCHQKGFWEIETPYLTRSTPEGARDYLVPSRVRRGRFYALPQSPQLFKQLLMVGGTDRYFQIARCFRDEDLRANRQPEFSQVDVEMSFSGQEEVLAFAGGLVQNVYRQVLGREIELPLDRMTYREAMDLYGTDKPDLRLGSTMADLSHNLADSEFRVFSGTVERGGCIKGIRAPGLGGYSRRQLDEIEEIAKKHGAGGLLWFRVEGEDLQSPVRKHLSDSEVQGIRDDLELEPGDLGLLVAGEWEVAVRSLGAVRTHLGRQESWADGQPDAFLWITDFPLLEMEKEQGRLVSRHHPFTAAHPDDLERLESEPLSVRAQAYDLVLNGQELAGGSVRNHNPDLQRRMFRALSMEEDEMDHRFGFLLEALSLGAPPHAGIAFGVERLIMEMAGTDHIRDVIAFPKTATATCAMTGAPTVVDDQQLAELGLQLEPEEDPLR